MRVGGVAELKDIKHREVDLTFAGVLPAAEFRAVAGVERLELLPDGRTLRVTIHGDLDPLIKMAARYQLANFVSREPSLEDVFLRSYQDDDEVPAKDTARLVS